MDHARGLERARTIVELTPRLPMSSRVRVSTPRAVWNGRRESSFSSRRKRRFCSSGLLRVAAREVQCRTQDPVRYRPCASSSLTCGTRREKNVVRTPTCPPAPAVPRARGLLTSLSSSQSAHTVASNANKNRSSAESSTSQTNLDFSCHAPSSSPLSSTFQLLCPGRPAALPSPVHAPSTPPTLDSTRITLFPPTLSPFPFFRATTTRTTSRWRSYPKGRRATLVSSSTRSTRTLTAQESSTAVIRETEEGRGGEAELQVD